METSKDLANRLSEVLLNGKWIANTNYKAELEYINWQQATKKIDQFNTIADLTFHINYYIEGVLNVLKGGKLTISDKFSFDSEPISSEEDWQKMKDDFLSNAEAIIHEISKLSESKWPHTFIDSKYGTYQRNIEGLIEHSYYHLGQIVWLKKM